MENQNSISEQEKELYLIGLLEALIKEIKSGK